MSGASQDCLIKPIATYALATDRSHSRGGRRVAPKRDLFYGSESKSLFPSPFPCFTSMCKPGAEGMLEEHVPGDGIIC